MLPNRLFGFFDQGKSHSGGEEGTVRGNPDGRRDFSSQIKAREELPGGEWRSAPEGPRFLRGLGIPPKIGAKPQSRTK